MYYSGVFDGLFVIGPARDLVGTWKTSYATQFYVSMEGESSGYFYRDMTWVISATNDPNTVNIKITWTTSNSHVSSSWAYVSEVQPLELTGTISGTRLIVNAPADSGPIHYLQSFGNYTFTSSYIEGTWHDDWEGLYRQHDYTATDGLKLIKQ
jgi:hypothetical protein